jgi:hypothetical protein
MSECLDQTKKQGMPSPKNTYDACTLEPSENKIRHFSDKNDGVIQFIRFTQNKDGFIE